MTRNMEACRSGSSPKAGDDEVHSAKTKQVLPEGQKND
jgi:hypothetical protein